jgi:uncharacterized coiled-coil protein SlyX
MKKLFSVVLLLYCFSLFSQTNDLEERINKLEETLLNQSKTIQEQQKIIDELKSEIEAMKLAEESVKKEIPPIQEKEEFTLKPGALFGSSALMNPNISVVVDTSAYTSNLTKEELEHRYLLGFLPSPHNHEEDRLEHGHLDEEGGYGKGFHFNYAELYLYAPVDPYFNLYTVIPFSEDGSEVEEAYFVTTSLPYGFQIKGGKFKSGIGRLNSQHAHNWDFYDAPLPYTAFLGGEGMSDKGVSVNYLPSLPFYLNLGAEIFQGENEILFGKEAKNGPHAYSLYAKTSFDFGIHSTILTGISILKGNTYTQIGEDSYFDGKSSLYDFEFTYKWKKSKYKGFTLQSEYLCRKQKGSLDNENLSDSLRRVQDGFYIQALYLFGNGRWRVGTRYDRLNLFKDSYKLNDEDIYFGKDPYRLSAMVEYNPTEFTRIRLQYNHDKSYRVQKTNKEFVLQFIFGIGAHAAHAF